MRGVRLIFLTLMGLLCGNASGVPRYVLGPEDIQRLRRTHSAFPDLDNLDVELCNPSVVDS
jgi:hypothetical protein